MLLICDICEIGLPPDQTECPMCKLKAELQNTLEDVGRLSKDHKTLIKQRDALCKALKDCRDTLVLCALIDKSGQAQKSALLAEQALKGGVK